MELFGLLSNKGNVRLRFRMKTNRWESTLLLTIPVRWLMGVS